MEISEFARRMFGRFDGSAEPAPSAGTDWRNRPPGFRAYSKTTRIPLPAADTLLRDYGQSNSAFGRALTFNDLATCAYFSLAPLNRKLDMTWVGGVAPLDPFAQEFGRGSSSGGGLYPTQLYVTSASPEILPQGIFGYEPARHALARLGSQNQFVDINSAISPKTDEHSTYIIITCEFWNTCFKYGDFGYHVCNLDAGAVSSTILTILRDVGISQTLYVDFDDSLINDVIGIDCTVESVIAIIGVDAPHRDSVKFSASGDEYGDGGARPSPLGSGKSRRLSRELIRAHELISRSRASEVAEAKHLITPAPRTAPRTFPSDVLHLLNSRRSAWGSLYSDRGISAGDLLFYMEWCFNNCGLRGSPGLIEATFRYFRAYIYARNVVGLTPSAYTFDSEGSSLDKISVCEPVSWQAVYAMENYNLDEAAFISFFACDFASLVGAFGPRAYRLATLVGGALIQAGYVSAAHFKWDAGASLGLNTRLLSDIFMVPKGWEFVAGMYVGAGSTRSTLYHSEWSKPQ